MDFHGEKRSNDTHESTTDPESRLARKWRGMEAKLAFAQHVLRENRNGLIVDVVVTEATGTAEREAALNMLDESLVGSGSTTLAADRGYHTRSFIAECSAPSVTPHIATNEKEGNCNRPTDDAARGVRRQPADPQACRGDLWLDDHRRLPQDALQGHRTHAARLAAGRQHPQPAPHIANLTPRTA